MKRGARKTAAIEQAEREKAAEKEIKASYKDGVTFESGDKETSLSINGRFKLAYIKLPALNPEHG